MSADDRLRLSVAHQSEDHLRADLRRVEAERDALAARVAELEYRNYTRRPQPTEPTTCSGCGHPSHDMDCNEPNVPDEPGPCWCTGPIPDNRALTEWIEAAIIVYASEQTTESVRRAIGRHAHKIAQRVAASEHVAATLRGER